MAHGAEVRCYSYMPAVPQLFRHISYSASHAASAAGELRPPAQWEVTVMQHSARLLSVFSLHADQDSLHGVKSVQGIMWE
ncbi:hypothetical protein E2C01_096371 [Portunus trituberculatus]|uniref:Uncharacterized protein n=1 Tax=Portunus trituberculatus TaxID=210409 RepID=A0A5B7K1U8_PORTR|nr:hypothetical protein [Portunus trituberculatus]